MRVLFILLWGILTYTPSLLATELERVTMQYKTAIFAGGCFWCMEKPFDQLEGVTETLSGYTGGDKKDPSYSEVSSGTTGHAEAIQITYDPTKISYEKLLEVFWKNIDPTVKDRQFCDYGTQYRSGIFYADEKEKQLAIQSKDKIAALLSGNKVYTEITAASHFYPAEAYHQNYYIKNPVRYKYYRYRCGRDERLEELWGSKEKRK